MVHKCCVRGCKSVWSHKGSITFHGFPSDVDRRIKWLKAIKLKKKYYSGAKICSKHFKRKDYDHTNRRLKLWAVPYDPAFETETVMPASSEMDKYSDEEHEETEKNKTRSTATQHDMTFEETTGVSLSDHQSFVRNTSPKESAPEPNRTSILMDMLTAPRKKPFFENDSVISKLYQDKYEKMTETQDSYDDVIMAHRSIQVKIATPREVRLRKRNKVLAQKVGRQAKTIEAMKSLIAKLKNNTKTELKNKIMVPGNCEDVSIMMNKITKSLNECCINL